MMSITFLPSLQALKWSDFWSNMRLLKCQLVRKCSFFVVRFLFCTFSFFISKLLQPLLIIKLHPGLFLPPGFCHLLHVAESENGNTTEQGEYGHSQDREQ